MVLLLADSTRPPKPSSLVRPRAKFDKPWLPTCAAVARLFSLPLLPIWALLKSKPGVLEAA